MLLVSLVLPPLFGSGEKRLLLLVSYCVTAMSHPSLPRDIGLFGLGLEDVIYISLPIIGAITLVSLFVTFMQVRFVVATEAMKPTFSRISPLNGIKRFFSVKSLWSLMEQSLVLVAIGGIAYMIMDQVIHTLVGARPTALGPVLGYLGSQLLLLIRYVSLVGVVLGIVDYTFQRWQTMKSLKMTKQEVKEESKAAEGDPHLKGMVRKRMYQIARTQMLAAVRTADVVVTNPTHYAVALRYDATRSAAPRVVAKGSDQLAQRIREEAATSEIPVVEDPPLARYLYAICDVDESIPGEIFVAVARLLAFVYSLPAALRGVGVHHLGASILPAEPAALAKLRDGQRARAEAVLAGTVAT